MHHVLDDLPSRRHPEMLKRLREEIEEVTGSELEIARSHTKKMPYLTAVLNESEFSRLNPGKGGYVALNERH
jgi:hypothetical protein